MDTLLKHEYESNGIRYMSESCVLEYVPEEFGFNRAEVVCFTHEDNVVLVQDDENSYKLPSITLHGPDCIGDDLDAGLYEGCTLQVEDWAVLGYEIVHEIDRKDDTRNTLKLIARVTLLEKTENIADVSTERVVVPYATALKISLPAIVSPFWVRQGGLRLKQNNLHTFRSVALDT